MLCHVFKKRNIGLNAPDPEFLQVATIFADACSNVSAHVDSLTSSES